MATKQPDFIKRYSPELQQRIKDRLQVPEIREAMSYWVMAAVEKLGQVKSRKHIIGYLLAKLAPHGCTLPEVEYIFDVAWATYQKQRRFSVEISSANSRNLQN